MRQANFLIAGLRKALPDATITVGSVIQANATDRAFVESYPKEREELRSEWRWRQVQMRLARKMVEHFEGRGAERIYLVPTHMAVDPTIRSKIVVERFAAGHMMYIESASMAKLREGLRRFIEGALPATQRAER